MRTHGRTDMTKLIVACRSFAKCVKTVKLFKHLKLTQTRTGIFKVVVHIGEAWTTGCCLPRVADYADTDYPLKCVSFPVIRSHTWRGLGSLVFFLIY